MIFFFLFYNFTLVLKILIKKYYTILVVKCFLVDLHKNKIDRLILYFENASIFFRTHKGKNSGRRFD